MYNASKMDALCYFNLAQQSCHDELIFYWAQIFTNLQVRVLNLRFLSLAYMNGNQWHNCFH